MLGGHATCASRRTYFHTQMHRKEQSCSLLPFLDVAVAYKATWLRSSKVNVGAILLGVKSPQCPIHTEPTLGLLANGPQKA